MFVKCLEYFLVFCVIWEKGCECIHSVHKQVKSLETCDHFIFAKFRRPRPVVHVQLIRNNVKTGNDRDYYGKGRRVGSEIKNGCENLVMALFLLLVRPFFPWRFQRKKTVVSSWGKETRAKEKKLTSGTNSIYRKEKKHTPFFCNAQRMRKCFKVWFVCIA